MSPSPRLKAGGNSGSRRLRGTARTRVATGTRSVGACSVHLQLCWLDMNVMITDISEDLDTTVQGVQIAITIFLLVMAALASI
jgi:hypothetical protein